MYFIPEVELSVLIPAHARPEKLDRCLEHLARQVDAPEFEVIVGIDDAERCPLKPSVPEAMAVNTRIERFGKLGYIAVRHRLLQLARGRVFLSLNDDSYPAPDCLAAHWAAHQSEAHRVVTGPSPFARVDEPNLFDRLVAQTQLLFFAHDGIDSTMATPTTYRHIYGLNMSAPTALAMELGGFPDIANAYGYDDIELAYRLEDVGNAQLVFAPNARVEHHHRMTPRDVHRREYLLGRSAWRYARFNPEFARDLFGRDIRSDEELAFCGAFLSHGRADAQRVERSFLELEHRAPDCVEKELLPTLAQQWIPLKRYLWRWGLLDAAHDLPERWSLLGEAPAPP